MSEVVNHIDTNSDLGEKLKEIKLDYFSDWALIAMEDMDEEAVERLNARAVSIGSKAIDEVNAIHNIRENVAVMSMVVFNLAVSLYLSIDQAMTAMEIEERSGATMRLTEMERAERKMVRGRLEAMSVKRLRELAKEHGVNLHGATTHLTIVNTLMANYDKWKGEAHE